MITLIFVPPEKAFLGVCWYDVANAHHCASVSVGARLLFTHYVNTSEAHAACRFMAAWLTQSSS